MKKIIYLILGLVVLFNFSGCGNKTTYNQYSGAFLDTEKYRNDVNKHMDFTEFRNEEMSVFKEYANRIYTEIEATKKETEKYSMNNRQIRDRVLYNKKEER